MPGHPLDPDAPGIPRGPVVLVGLSGAGKTVVGRLLADRLGWAFLDLDAEIERLAGRTVAEVFEAGGEASFRELERRVTLAADVPLECIVSTGGGWMMRPGLRDIWAGAVRVWLQVAPATAAARLAREHSTRPLLAGPDPEGALQRMLEERLPAYRLSEVHVPTDGTEPSGVVDAVCEELAKRGYLPATR